MSVASVRKAERPARLRRFKPYPAYKDSGVEWLGEIPAHWEVGRLKHFAVLNPESLPEDTDPRREMVYVDIGGVDSLGRIVEREQLTFGSAPSRARRLVRDGDVIVSTVRTYLRAIAPISDPEPGTVVSTGFAVVRPAADLTTDYAAYALRAPYFVERVVANSKGVSFPAINESEMATYELAAPPEPEQRAIAAFLDRETARIDGLVAKKERLIELLEEKRTALITRAVTKGLDPNVPMKDSGVEWLGEIPAHWEVRRLRSTVTGCQNGVWGDEPDGLHDIPCVRVADFDRVTFRVNMVDPTLRSIEYQVVEARGLHVGDLLLEKSGGGENQPVGVVVTYDQGIPAVCSNFIARVTVAEGYGPRFLTYLHAALYALRVNTRHIKQSTGIQNLDSASYLGEATGFPDADEQRAIGAFLDRETARIDALVAKVREALDRLEELRTALISAAVTGKIDVGEEIA